LRKNRNQAETLSVNYSNDLRQRRWFFPTVRFCKLLPLFGRPAPPAFALEAPRDTKYDRLILDCQKLACFCLYEGV